MPYVLGAEAFGGAHGGEFLARLSTGASTATTGARPPPSSRTRRDCRRLRGPSFAPWPHFGTLEVAVLQAKWRISGRVRLLGVRRWARVAKRGRLEPPRSPRRDTSRGGARKPRPSPPPRS